jgi:hypothetical protein
MDTLTESPSAPTVEARLVTGEARLRTLPKHFGPRQLTVEHAVFAWMAKLAAEYRGGFWQFYELSNGGFYMAPDLQPLHLRVDGNGYDGQMSADAAGITACLFAFSHLSFQYSDDMMGRHYHQLHEFAAAHAEAAAIFAACD